jgi:hypothetical protein
MKLPRLLKLAGQFNIFQRILKKLKIKKILKTITILKMTKITIINGGLPIKTTSFFYAR